MIILAIALTVVNSIKNKKTTNLIPKSQVSNTETVYNIKAFKPVLKGENDLLYYDLNEANLYQLNLSNGQKTQLSDNMAQPLDLIWSPDRNQVIIKITYDKYKFEKFNSPFLNLQVQDGETMLWNYNLQTKKYTMLDLNILNPAPLNLLNPIWVSDSQHIIYHYLNSNNKISTLNISSPDGQNWRKLGDVPPNIFSILNYNENNNTVVYQNIDNTENNTYSVYRFDINNQKEEKIISNTDIVIKINDYRFIYNNPKNSYVFNITNNNQQQLPVLLFGEKATISPDGKNLFAIIIKDNIQQIAQINLTNYKLTKVFNPNLPNPNISNLLIKNDILYYTVQDTLYKIKI